MATTRLQLFQDIALELGDFIELEATATGTTTTFVSTEDMLFPDGSLDGREAWYATAQTASTANAQTRRLITDTDYDNATIEVSPAWSANPQIGDVLYLVNSRGTGVTVKEIHQKINQLIRRVAVELGDEVAGTPQAFDYTSPALAVPTTWEDVLGVQVEFDSTTYAGIYDSVIGDPLTYQRADRTAVVKPQFRAGWHGLNVRLIGTTAAAELSDDTDTTSVPASWIAKLGAAQLLEAAAKRSGDITTALTYGELVKAEAAQLENRIGRRRSAVGRRFHFGSTA